MNTTFTTSKNSQNCLKGSTQDRFISFSRYLLTKAQFPQPVTETQYSS